MIDVPGTIESANSTCVTVNLAIRTGCGACDSGAGCGLGSLLHLFARGEQPRLRIPVSRPGEFGTGERVRLSIGGGRLLALAVAAYGLPLLGLFFGACVGIELVPRGGDAAAAAGAAVGAAACWVSLRLCGLDRGLRSVLQNALRHSP